MKLCSGSTQTNFSKEQLKELERIDILRDKIVQMMLDCDIIIK